MSVVVDTPVVIAIHAGRLAPDAASVADHPARGRHTVRAYSA